MPLLNYNSPRELAAFLESRNLGMRKKYGQNFLIDARVRNVLVEALAPRAGEAVWEIGPGLGAMTSSLLERGARVTAFEIDPGFSGALEEFFGANPGFTLVRGDVLKTWPLAAPSPLLLGNLPYNIGAVLLASFIEARRFFRRMVVTVQRETARRMLAGPGSGEYSSFSVLCRSVYRLRSLTVIKGAAFFPVPRVDSQGLCLDLINEDPHYPQSLYPLVRQLFSSRRKTVRNNLTTFVKSCIMGNAEAGREAGHLAEKALKTCGIKPDARAEQLGLKEFVKLAGFLEECM
ncbi:MAG: 16S rRNA (adenine(1518)-N(6)/adenine(1519)-N(6))-dimethyltransferase RsmA [Treponema sp.]|nr:16S rRNA (adenine(1518)-N(6)/adenine(1519)-N(6))-dimethyltransferase RsmA [Treponema sp.]